ncbi:MAG: HlyD family efflux transporter periplasmic adaptor subunit [Gemmatimonadota bacterium]
MIHIRFVHAAVFVVGLAACGPKTLTLTGVVTTNDVIVSPQVTGQLGSLSVVEGDTVIAGQLLGVIVPDELRADSAYAAENAAGFSAQVDQAAATARWQAQQTKDQIKQAEANAASAAAAETAAVADAEMAELTYKRTEALAKQGLETPQLLDQARTATHAAQARKEAAAKQTEAATAAVALARSDLEQNAVRRSQLANSRSALGAASAQRAKAGVRLGYAELRAPISGVVDVRAARPGEVVTAGQPVVTLINPDDLWVRGDVEESYIDRVRLGDTLTIRLPSGAERRGVVFFRGVDAGYATRRDVSRTKRDIKTFEIRLRTDNKDRRLAVGQTAYVLLPVK